MADRKISDLTALTTPAAGDFLPIVDVSESAASAKNKRITLEELMRGAPDGTAAAPSIAFESDDDTGLFSAGANQLGVTTGGVERLRVTDTGQLGSISLGSAAAPAWTFNGDLNTGIYSPGADQLALSTNGVARFTASTTALTAALPVAYPLGAVGTPSVTFTGDLNTGWWSPAADTLAASTDGVERVRFNPSGAVGFAGANFGTAGQALISNGSSAAPSWQSMPPAVFGWNHTNDNYGLYLLGTSISTGSLSGTADISVQSRMRRCIINDSGVVQYYLDADDTTKKAASWLRIVETESLDTAYTGTTQEATNSLLRVGVPAWDSSIVFAIGQRVTHGGSLWECLAATTPTVTSGSFVVGVEYVIRTVGTTDFVTEHGASANTVGVIFTAAVVGTGTGTARETPQAGTVASVLDGTDGQVMVEIPAFSVRYGFAGGVHTREVRLGCNDSLIAQGFQPHPAFIKTDGTYKAAFYMGAYHAFNASGNVLASVSGQNNLVSQTRATFRTRAVARGTGWHIHSYLEHAAIQTLLVCEYRDHNSQKVVGNGAMSGSVFVVASGLSNGRGNRSGNAFTSGGNVADYMSYRGIENLYGRAWQWVDGMNVYERVVYLTNNQTAFADNTSAGYRFYAQVPTGSASYQKEIFPLPDVFLPSVVTGASDTSYLGDGFWTGAGWRVALVGSGSDRGALVGTFALNLFNDSSDASVVIGARSAYAAN